MSNYRKRAVVMTADFSLVPSGSGLAHIADERLPMRLLQKESEYEP